MNVDPVPFVSVKLVSLVSYVSKITKVPMESADSRGEGESYVVVSCQFLARISIQHQHYIHEDSLKLNDFKY